MTANAVAKLPPGPTRPALFQTIDWARRPWELLDRCSRRFGSRFTLRFLGGRDFVIVSAPEDVRAVYTAPADVLLSGRANRNFKPFLGERSLFVLDHDDHRRHRKLLLPPFRGERMRSYGDIMRDLTARAVARWPVGQAFPVIESMHEVTLHVIFQAVFGVREEARMRFLTSAITRLTGRASALIAFIEPLRRDLGRWSPWGRFLEARRDFYAVMDEEIAAARKAPAGAREDILAKLVEESARGDVAGGGPLRPDGEPGMSDEELRNELLTLLGAGHETTTASLAWAFRWILASPVVRERVVEEVRGTLGGRALEVADIPKLKYLDACVNEALRLSPPIPITLREAARPFHLAGFELPEGTVVLPSPYLASRDPVRFPDPLRFDPSRFQGDARPGPFDFFPFGGGNRLCIGLPFAIFEMKVILATVFARADLRLACAPTHASRRQGIIVQPADGTRVIVERMLASPDSRSS